MSDVFGKKFLKQYAVYWAPTGQTGVDGEELYEDPVEIRCRWEDKPVAFMDNMNNEATSKAEVMVDRDLVNLGVLWQGRLADVESETDPFANTNAWKIRQFAKIPDPKARRFVRTAYL